MRLNTVLTPAELDRLVVGAGITDPDARAIAVAIALAESGGQVGATHRNSDRNRSTDYGLWQINGFWHPTYDPTKLLSEPAYNASAMAQISNGGTNWGPWSVYNSGRYKAKLPAAEAAVAANGATGGTGARAAAGETGGAGATIGGAVAGVTDFVSNWTNPGAAAGEVLGSVFGQLFRNWQRDVLGLILGGVFVTGALALVAIGLSKLSGIDGGTVMARADEAATVAGLAGGGPAGAALAGAAT